MTDLTQPIHASAFAHNGAGCLILGPSGSGKSRIMAEAMALGAKMVADDRVQLMPMAGLLAAAPVAEIASIVELRGLGLVRMNDALTRHVLHLVVELDPAATDRLPIVEKRDFLGVVLPYVRIPPAPHTHGGALMIFLKAMQEGRVLPADWRPKAV